MASAKFIVVGETGMWARVRIQEEITSHGLDGAVVAAGGGGLGVFVSGDRMRIQRLYNDLSDNLPAGVEPTNLIYGQFKRPDAVETPAGGADAFATLIGLLKEIEKNTRRINQKLDKLIDARGSAQSTLYGSPQSESGAVSSSAWGWGSTETSGGDGDGKEGEDTATDAFSQMFG